MPYLCKQYRSRSTLVLLNSDMPYLCKQYRSRSVGFFRSQLIWICTVCHSACEFYQQFGFKESDWLTIRNGCGILIYSKLQGLSFLNISQGTTVITFEPQHQKTCLQKCAPSRIFRSACTFAQSDQNLHWAKNGKFLHADNKD